MCNTKKYNFLLLKNENDYDHLPWLAATKKVDCKITIEVVDINNTNLLNEIRDKKPDLVILRPPGQTEFYKKIYDEKAIIISTLLKIPVYPTLSEILIYENKRFLHDWLVANNLPHPKTYVYFNKNQASKYISEYNTFPLVAKTNIGAAGNGVQILKNKNEATDYINKAFSTGIKTRTGPKFKKGSIIKKLLKAITNKGFILKRLKDYAIVSNNPQKGFLIFQEFIPHSYEWRCVKIGDSYFAHKKIAVNNMSSGTLIKGYDAVPFALLDFIKTITEKTDLSSVAIDLFESNDGYLINEIQCYFGQSDPYQMLVDGKPGRYRYLNNSWCFEEGDYASNACYDLRLKHALTLIELTNQ